MIEYLTTEDVLVIHDGLIERFGGSHGVRDLGLLESAVARPRAGFRDFEAYPTLWHKAAVLAHSIIHNHPFLDGNKRTAVTAAAVMVELNGYTLTSSQSAFVDLALSITKKKLDEEQIAAWYENHAK